MMERLVTDGFLDGRYLAATFNLLRGNDLIWSYVVNNYLMADDYSPFDLLYWNGDTTNLPAKWLRAYLEDFYRDNRLVQADSLSVDGTPIDLRRITVPAYIQAGIEDHIAPARSVWKMTNHLSGPYRFVLAGSGHIAGVVNPPEKHKYQHWTCDEQVGSLDEFRAKATESKGSWWPDWAAWITALDPKQVPATKARKPGRGRLAAVEDAPGRYVLTR
jgi:polyhydroxyalkanoate synthase